MAERPEVERFMTRARVTPQESPLLRVLPLCARTLCKRTKNSTLRQNCHFCEGGVTRIPLPAGEYPGLDPPANSQESSKSDKAVRIVRIAKNRQESRFRTLSATFFNFQWRRAGVLDKNYTFILGYSCLRPA